MQSILAQQIFNKSRRYFVHHPVVQCPILEQLWDFIRQFWYICHNFKWNNVELNVIILYSVLRWLIYFLEVAHYNDQANLLNQHKILDLYINKLTVHVRPRQLDNFQILQNYFTSGNLLWSLHNSFHIVIWTPAKRRRWNNRLLHAHWKRLLPATAAPISLTGASLGRRNLSSGQSVLRVFDLADLRRHFVDLLLILTAAYLYATTKPLIRALHTCRGGHRCRVSRVVH